TKDCFQPTAAEGADVGGEGDCGPASCWAEAPREKLQNAKNHRAPTIIHRRGSRLTVFRSPAIRPFAWQNFVGVFNFRMVNPSHSSSMRVAQRLPLSGVSMAMRSV